MAIMEFRELNPSAQLTFVSVYSDDEIWRHSDDSRIEIAGAEATTGYISQYHDCDHVYWVHFIVLRLN